MAYGLACKPASAPTTHPISEPWLHALSSCLRKITSFLLQERHFPGWPLCLNCPFGSRTLEVPALALPEETMPCYEALKLLEMK